MLNFSRDDFEKLKFECYLCGYSIEWGEFFYTFCELNKNNSKIIRVEGRAHENCYSLLPYNHEDKYVNNLDNIMFLTTFPI